MCWWWASGEAWRQLRGSGKPGAAHANPDFEPPAETGKTSKTPQRFQPSPPRR